MSSAPCVQATPGGNEQIRESFVLLSLNTMALLFCAFTAPPGAQETL